MITDRQGKRYRLFLGVAEQIPLLTDPKTTISTVHIELCLRIYCKDCDNIVPRHGTANVITLQEISKTIEDHERAILHVEVVSNGS